MKALFFALSIFLSLPALGGLAKFEKNFFLHGCHLFSWKGRLVQSLPGFLCIPLEDGRVVSGSETNIRMIGTDKSIEWEVDNFLHHQMNLSPDGKRILALGSELREESGKNIRYDEFLVISLDGKILARNSIRHLTKDFVDNPIDAKFANFFRNASRERTHFNSIFEIGPLTSSSHPAVKEGNIIVNGLFTGTYILTPDLKKVLYHFKIPGSNIHHIHDVKVLPDGKIFLFNNEVRGDGESFPHSALQEIDPVTLKSLYSFTGENGIPFYSSHCGGVQKLDDEFYLISHMVNGSYIFSKKTGKVIRSIHEPYFQFNQLWLIQNLRLIPLSETFKKVWDM